MRKAERQAWLNCTAEHARDMHAVEYIERLFDDASFRKEVEKGLAPELSNRSYRKCLADAMKLKGKKI
ncbi:hypothetical protein MTO96_024549 [Rhipicephalus appendiculatus]